jgi:hypothetical protein
MPRLEAHFENRVYYFELIQKDDKQVRIEIYSTPYVLVKTKSHWENHLSNKNDLAAGVINSVMETLGMK